MPDNEIICEIHRHREALARRCHFDINKLMEFYRERDAESERAGRKLVSLTPTSEGTTSVVREDSQQK